MFVKEQKILKRIALELSELPEVLRIVAYGSRVRGDFRADSDLDVLVVIKKRDLELRERIIDVFYEYELETEIPFSLTILSTEEIEVNESLGSPFLEKIKEEGLLIYDAEKRRQDSTIKIQT